MNTDRTDQALQSRAEELGIRVGFLSEYASLPSSAFAHTLIVNYAGLKPERLPEAMELLDQLFAE